MIEHSASDILDDDLTGPAKGIGKIEQLRFAANPKIAAAMHTVLEEIGEDPNREGLLNTPSRVAAAYAELTAGYHVDPEALLNDAVFTEHYNEMVLVRDIHYYSMCEHHMMPFYGHAHVAYLPNGKIIGLSKIPRIVDMFARRLQVQERLTAQIANFLQQAVDAAGVAVVVEGVHMCAMMRGVRKESVNMVTSALHGVFQEDARTRGEFMGLINRRQING